MKLLHTREARMVSGRVRRGESGAELEIEGHTYGVLEASDAGLQIVDASDQERSALVEAGYALPSHVGAGAHDDA